MDRSTGTLRMLDEEFDRLLELDPQARRCRLDELRAERPAMADELVRLLALCERADTTLEPAGALHLNLVQECLLDAGTAPALEPGSSIGPYVIQAQIGRGGMSEVYRAARQFDGFTQVVALKLVRSIRPDVNLRNYLQAEQRTLARLNHPNIARFLDAGIAPDGAAFLAMELVEGGMPADQYCEKNRLGIRERLVIFLQAAKAVAYAHSSLVVHCDIKPGNVLVDCEGHPKLVDFGIARYLASTVPEAPHPGAGLSPVTVGYASPEQLAGEPVGAASDIYQLGLLLHVLVAGGRPGQDDLAGPDEGGSRRACRMPRGDLGSIVERATNPDPASRYGSVAQLAEDVRSYLDHRPVSARGYGASYVLSRFVRRHAAASTVVALLAASLLAFSVVISSLAVSIDRERARAMKQRSVNAQAFEFMIQRFRELEPEKSGRRGSIVKEALDRAAAAPASRFGADAQTTAELHALLGRGYLLLQEYDESYAQYREMYRHATAMGPSDRAAYEGRALIGIGNAAQLLGRTPEAREAFEKVARLEPGDPSSRVARAAALGNLAALYSAEGDVARARKLMSDEVIPALGAELGSQHPAVFAARSNDARFLMGQERRSPRPELALCVQLTGELADDADAGLGAGSEIAVRIRLDHYWALAHLGEHEQAIEGLGRMIPRARQLLGDDHLNVIISRRVLGVALASSGRVDEGLAELEAAVEAMQRMFPRSHKNRSWTLFDYALGLALAGRDEEAIRALLESGIDPGQISGEPRLRHLLGDARVGSLLGAKG